jgi:nucleotide-binding universal stress UspA family protein
MHLQHIVAAADETEASRNAIRAALAWGRRAGAQVSIVSVGHLRSPAGVDARSSAAAIERWLGTQIGEWDPSAPLIAEVSGIPSVEIPRFAEEAAADLLVLGRKARSAQARRLLGDTADAVARRSPVPCLFVPGPDDATGPMLAAVDGTERGFAVVRGAAGFAKAVDARLDFVTVEPSRSDEPAHLADGIPSARTENLRRALGSSGTALRIRRGDIVAEILREIDAGQARVLVVGYRRGGPPAPIEGGSVARQLLHRAPCAVLTIPL